MAETIENQEFQELKETEHLEVLTQDGEWRDELLIPSIDTNDTGGNGGANSVIFKQLAGRTNWLKNLIESFKDTFSNKDHTHDFTHNHHEEYASKSHTHSDYLVASDLNWSVHGYSTDNGADARITEENIFGDTSVSLLKETLNVSSFGNIVIARVSLTISAFNKNVANDAKWSFKYNILDGIKSTGCNITSITYGGYGIGGRFYFTGDLNGGRDVARQPCYSSVSTNGTCYFSANDTIGHDTGWSGSDTTKQVDDMSVEATFIMRVNRG